MCCCNVKFYNAKHIFPLNCIFTDSDTTSKLIAKKFHVTKLHIATKLSRITTFHNTGDAYRVGYYITRNGIKVYIVIVPILNDKGT